MKEGKRRGKCRISKIGIISFHGPMLYLEVDRGSDWNKDGNTRFLGLMYSLSIPKNLPKFIEVLKSLTSKLEEEQRKIIQGPN